MFTGIVEEVGTVERVGTRLRVRCARVLDGLVVDSSLNVQGVCLTVVACDVRGVESDLVEETRRRSTLGSLAPGARVNLERAVTPSTALGGHLVQGHVDGTATLLEREGERLRFSLEPDWSRYVVEKGFIAIDGVSLTVAGLGEANFEIALVPHTGSHTTLGALRAGDRVNIEVDILAKYVERLLGEARRR